MRGGGRELEAAVRVGAFPVAEALLLVLTVAAVVAHAGGGGSEPSWTVAFVPFLFALVVCAHRAMDAWRFLRERRWPPDSARTAVAGLWAAVEVLAAFGFLVLVAAFVVGLLTTARTLSGDALSLTVRSVFGAAAMLILLVLAVGLRLVAAGIGHLTGRVAATGS